MKATYSLDGVRGLQASLERGGQALQRRVSVALEQSARNVQRSAQQFAPRDQGDLIRAIKYTGKNLSFRVGIDNVTLRLRGGNSAHQNPAVYGVWYELGFVTRNIRAHPYMGPASQREERAHKARIEEAINGALSEVAA